MKDLSALLAIAILAVIALTGFAIVLRPTTAELPPPRHDVVSREYTVVLSDGRRVLCIAADNVVGGGFSCDWEHAK